VWKRLLKQSPLWTHPWESVKAKGERDLKGPEEGVVGDTIEGGLKAKGWTGNR
jgi:hypothetical protein